MFFFRFVGSRLDIFKKNYLMLKSLQSLQSKFQNMPPRNVGTGRIVVTWHLPEILD